MKIAVILRDTGFFYGSAIGIDPVDGRFNEKDMITILNPYDESALMLALDQKDLDHEAEIIVVGMNSEGSSDTLKKGLCMGADRGVLLSREAAGSLSIEEEVLLWCKGLSTIEWEILLVGASTIDTHSDEFGVYLGEYLKLNVVMGITSLKILANKKVSATRKLEKGHRQIVECDLPAILTVEQTGTAKYPTLRNIALSKEGKILYERLREEEKKKSGEKTALQKYSPPRARPKKGLPEIDGSLSVSDRLSQLFSGGVTEKKSEEDELMGPADEVAEKLLNHLVQKNIL